MPLEVLTVFVVALPVTSGVARWINRPRLTLLRLHSRPVGGLVSRYLRRGILVNLFPGGWRAKSSSTRTILPFLLAGIVPLVGCGAGVQIAKVPFVSPLVLPSANQANIGEFQLIAAVHNYSTTATGPDLWLNIYTEYWPNCTASWCSAAWPGTVPPPGTTGPPQSSSDCLHVGALPPGGGSGGAPTTPLIAEAVSACRTVVPATSGSTWRRTQYAGSDSRGRIRACM